MVPDCHAPSTSSPRASTADKWRKTASNPRKPRCSGRKYAALLSERCKVIQRTELDGWRPAEPLLEKGSSHT